MAVSISNININEILKISPLSHSNCPTSDHKSLNHWIKDLQAQRLDCFFSEIPSQLQYNPMQLATCKIQLLGQQKNSFLNICPNVNVH